MLIAGYLMLCLLVALCGRNRRYGFVGALFMSLLITPVLAFLLLWITAPKVRVTADAVRIEKVIVVRSPGA